MTHLPEPMGGFLAAMAAALLGSARMLGCAAFLPLLGRRHTGRMVSNAVCLAVSLPQETAVWSAWATVDPTPWTLGLLAIKEALLGAAMGLVLSAPFWAVRSAFTLIDNQRGAFAAQQANPSLEADSSVLGDLAERAFVAWLAQAGLFVLLFDLVADTYALWPVLAPWPPHGPVDRAAALQILQGSVRDAAIYAGPALLLLLLVDLSLGAVSAVVDGIQVYIVAPIVKSLLALLLVALYAGSLWHLAGDHWRHDLQAFVRRPATAD